MVLIHLHLREICVCVGGHVCVRMCLYINTVHMQGHVCLCTHCHRSLLPAWGWSLSSLVLMKSLLSACNFSRFISTVISKGSLWRPSFSGDLGLSNENIIYPVTSELQEMVCWLFNDSLEIGSCGKELWGFVKHETKGGLAPKSTVSGLRDFRKMHPSIWKILCGTICMFAKLRLFPQWKYLLRKKGMLRVFISMQCFPSLCPKCGFCSFWPSESQPAAQQWVAQFQGWVRSRSKGMSYGDPNPLFWQYFFFKVPPVLHCFLIALNLQGMLVKRVGPSFIVCWWFSSSIFITDLSCCCNDTTLQL